MTIRSRLILLSLAAALAWAAPLRAEAAATSAGDSTRAYVFHVSGMTCALCGKAIRRSLRRVEGVRKVEVDRSAERVRVLASPAVGPDALEAAIEGAGGYRAELLEPAAHAPKHGEPPSDGNER